jgi:hypothetical protein
MRRLLGAGYRREEVAVGHHRAVDDQLQEQRSGQRTVEPGGVAVGVSIRAVAEDEQLLGDQRLHRTSVGAAVGLRPPPV